MRAVLRVSGREDARAAADILSARGYEVVAADPLRGQAVDLLVVDEWTPEDDPWVREARADGTPTAVLAELILADAPGPVVAITGTAGKTSTSRALAHLLTASGLQVCISDTARSGNAWPDHSLAGTIPPGAVVVAELTSTHLCHMGAIRADVGVVTTVRPDHVELHGSLERYVAAKRRLVDAVPCDAPVVLPVDDPATLRALGVPPHPDWGFGEIVGRGMGAFRVDAQVLLRAPGGEHVADLPTRGTAGRAVLAASAAALALGVPPRTIGDALATVPAPMHRMAARALGNGITLVDNTMAATPLKVAAGLADAPSGPLVLVVGGNRAPADMRVHDSPEEQRALSDALALARARASTLIAFGPASPDVRREVEPDAVVDDIRAAVALATSACPAGGTVMVAPMFPMAPEEREYVAGYALPD